MQADDRADLRQFEVGAERHAEFVPRKAGEDDAAQPFAEAQTDRQREHARRVGAPDQPRQREAEARKDRQRGRQAEHAERQRPGELVGVDEKRRPEPPQAGDEIAEAPPPAGAERRPQRRPERTAALGAVDRAVDQPHRQRHRHDQRRREVEGRHGERAHGAAGESDAAAPPAPGEYHRLREPAGRREARPGRVDERGVFAHLSPGAAPDSGGGAVRRAAIAVGERALGGVAPARRGARLDPQPLDPARIGVEHFEFEVAGAGDDFAADRHAAGGRGQQAADRVDVLGVGERREIDAERLGDVLQAGARFDDEGAVAGGGDLRPVGLVVLVLDVADDRLDHVLDRDEAVGAAVFVDHQRHVGVRRLHLHQQVERRHRRRREQHRAQDVRRRQRRVHAEFGDRLALRRRRLRRRLTDEAEARLGGEEVHEVADVDHAARIVERVAVDRQARMAGGAEEGEQFAERRLDADRDDVGARHHHVGDAHLVQRQHVLEDRPFLRREVGVGSRLLQSVLDVVAHRGGLEAEQGPQPLEQAGRALAGAGFGRGRPAGLGVVGRGHG